MINLVPKDMGVWVPAGSVVAFSTHYTPYGKETTEKTNMGLYFYPKGETPKYPMRTYGIYDYGINIPAGAQSGHQFRLRAKGMPVVRSAQKGDMYIEIGVETPVNLTAKQKELLKEFEKAGKTSPESEGFFSKVKEMFGGD